MELEVWGGVDNVRACVCVREVKAQSTGSVGRIPGVGGQPCQWRGIVMQLAASEKQSRLLFLLGVI